MSADRAATVADMLASIRRRLAAAGIASPALDARLLLMAATGLSHEGLIAGPDRAMAPDEAQRLAGLVARRLAREPLSRILGEREFYGRVFSIGPASLDPRPETETLVECALSFATTTEAPLNILDVGTGSGAILVTLLAEMPRAHGTGTDISPTALEMAHANALRHGVAERARFVCADWCRGVDGRFDLIVSNPPYIASRDVVRLAAEVRDYDPHLALDGGSDGLDAYRAIASAAGPLLAPGGLVALEIGAGQESAVAAVFVGRRWSLASAGGMWRDLAGHPRVLAFDQCGSLPRQQKRVGIRVTNR